MWWGEAEAWARGGGRGMRGVRGGQVDGVLSCLVLVRVGRVDPAAWGLGEGEGWGEEGGGELQESNPGSARPSKSAGLTLIQRVRLAARAWPSKSAAQRERSRTRAQRERSRNWLRERGGVRALPSESGA